MTQGARSILIYNPISGHGHLDSWLAMFVALLLERGWRVLVLTPDVAALRLRLDQKNLTHHVHLQILGWDDCILRDRFKILYYRVIKPIHYVVWLSRYSIVKIKSFLWGLWFRWDAFGDSYFYGRPGTEAIPGMPFLAYWKKRFLRAVIPFLFRASHFVHSRLYRSTDRVTPRPTDQDEAERDFFSPGEMAHRVEVAIERAKWPPQVALNMYMDMFKTGVSDWDAFDQRNTLSWVGVRFVPPKEPREAWYALPRWRGMCFLDDETRRAYQAVLPDKHFACLPDIVEAGLPATPGLLAGEIIRRAAGRRIVFLGGSIGGQKNLSSWYDLVALADPAQWFFVQVGEIHHGTLTAEDRLSLARVTDTPPENLLLHTEYLSDERAFNEVIAACDIIFAVYRQFEISSNMPGKAAQFGKPILVSDRYLMGARVREYGIGLAVDEDNSGAMHAALSALAETPVPAENFARYRADFSIEALGAHLDHLLDRCVDRKHPVNPVGEEGQKVAVVL